MVSAFKVTLNTLFKVVSIPLLKSSLMRVKVASKIFYNPECPNSSQFCEKKIFNLTSFIYFYEIYIIHYIYTYIHLYSTLLQVVTKFCTTLLKTDTSFSSARKSAREADL